nr:hypothetical protein CFP56_24865 [Quercus suber]
MKLWKFSKFQPSKLLGFGKHGRILFKTIAELVIVYHKKRKFSSHLLRKLRFFPNFREKHPFDPVENVTRREFLCGKKTDLLHMSSDDRKRFLNAVIDLKATVHSDVDKDMNSLFSEFCSKLLDVIFHGLHRQEVHLGSKNLVDILFANSYDSTKSYRFV